MSKMYLYSIALFLLLNTSASGQRNIVASGSLLINTESDAEGNALRVNGRQKVDSVLSVGADSDSVAFISINRNTKSSILGEDDKVSPYTSTPTAWSVNDNINIPVFRLRHPNNTANSPNPNTSIRRDFKILPYQYGMAIEYNGVVECWVGEWSIHKGPDYYDVEGKGNGWGAVSWVGDDQDGGGVRMTARNNLFIGGNVNYGEISVEKFVGTPNGDLRFRLPSEQNDFEFIYGERGSNNIIAKMKNEGLVIPKISSVSVAQSPERGQLVFDSTENEFKAYNGNSWVNFSGNKINTGSYSTTGNGSDNEFFIPHGVSSIPSYFNVIATSADAANIAYVTATAQYIIIHYTTAPPVGSNNLSWNWQANQ